MFPILPLGGEGRGGGGRGEEAGRRKQGYPYTYEVRLPRDRNQPELDSEARIGSSSVVQQRITLSTYTAATQS